MYYFLVALCMFQISYERSSSIHVQSANYFFCDKPILWIIIFCCTVLLKKCCTWIITFFFPMLFEDLNQIIEKKNTQIEEKGNNYRVICKEFCSVGWTCYRKKESQIEEKSKLRKDLQTVLCKKVEKYILHFPSFQQSFANIEADNFLFNLMKREQNCLKVIL